MGRKWEKLNSRCSTTTIATRTGVLTNPSRLPSPIFNLVYIVACLLESDYGKDKYGSDDMVSKI